MGVFQVSVSDTFFSVCRCRVTTEGDLNTYDLTLEIREHLCALFGDHCPPTICNDLARVKFDANRNKSVATFGVAAAVCAFEKYQSDIDNATKEIQRRRPGQAGIFIDIHGHSHRFQLSPKCILGNFVATCDLAILNLQS